MKITTSPLVASMSGSAADVTCASWKGILYARKKIIPANPKSAAQTLVRESLTRCVTLWRSLTSVWKAWLNTYGTNVHMSGYNVFTHFNRALEQAGGLLLPVPANPNCPAPDTLAFVTGVGVAGDIDVSWVDNSPDPFTIISFVLRLDGTNIFVTPAGAQSADEAATISGLTAGEDYDCYACFYNMTTGAFGTTDGDQGIAAMA